MKMNKRLQLLKYLASVIIVVVVLIRCASRNTPQLPVVADGLCHDAVAVVKAADVGLRV